MSTINDVKRSTEVEVSDGNLLRAQDGCMQMLLLDKVAHDMTFQQVLTC